MARPIRFFCLLSTILVLLAALACGTEKPELVATAEPTVEPTPTATAAPQPTTTTTPEPTPTLKPQTFNVGDTVRLGDFHITVNGVRASLGDDLWRPDEESYFVYVDVTFQNKGNQPEVVSSLLQMEIHDTEGRSYDVDFPATAAGSTSPPDGEIGPGGTRRGEVGYQLPTSATELTWRFSGDIFRLGQAVFSLGTIAVPVPPPGFTLDDPLPAGEVASSPARRRLPTDDPLPAGEVLMGSDGAEVRVVGINPNAWQQIARENQFNDPPEEGKRFYLITVEVALPSDASSSIRVLEYDFSLIGDNRVIYDSSNGCGVIHVCVR